MIKRLRWLIILGLLVGAGYYYFEVYSSRVGGETYTYGGSTSYTNGGSSFGNSFSDTVDVVYTKFVDRHGHYSDGKPQEGVIYNDQDQAIGRIQFTYHETTATANYYKWSDDDTSASYNNQPIGYTNYTVNNKLLNYNGSMVERFYLPANSPASTLSLPPITTQGIFADTFGKIPSLGAAPIHALLVLGASTEDNGLSTNFIFFIIVVVGMLLVIGLIQMLTRFFKGTGMNDKEAQGAAALTVGLGILGVIAATAEANKKAAERSHQQVTSQASPQPSQQTLSQTPQHTTSKTYEPKRCSGCNGKGTIMERCSNCKGAGTVQYGGYSNTSDTFGRECNSCRGRGHVEKQCYTCNGRGTV